MRAGSTCQARWVGSPARQAQSPLPDQKPLRNWPQKLRWRLQYLGITGLKQRCNPDPTFVVQVSRLDGIWTAQASNSCPGDPGSAAGPPAAPRIVHCLALATRTMAPR